MDDWKYPDPYLPIKSSKGELSLMSLEVCSERFLRRAIQSGELKHSRNSPHGQILVRLSWFDDWVETQEGEEFRIYQRASQGIQRILAEDAALEEKAQRLFEKIKKDEAIEVEVDRDFKKMKEGAAALEEEVQRDWERIKEATRKR